jgi:CubicO group peptidase (beta-lactamase class C family)
MKKNLIFLLLIMTSTFLKAQNLYFPPVFGNNWETTTPANYGWCEGEVNNLYTFLEKTNSKAFIVLKDGKIVLEKYFGTFQQDSLWYWASAGKSLTGFMVGVAQQEGKINIADKSSKYLGNGWTSLTAAQEDKITVKHQLTMTTGLDDGGDKDCTKPSCLTYKADAAMRWAYHNAPYTLLDKVIENGTGQGLNTYISSKLKSTMGFSGFFFKAGDNNVFYSTPRNMARFGLLILNKGKWNNTTILSDQNYYNAMVNTSQSLNESYGYLWWLNGKNSFMIPTLQTVFKGNLVPNAPKDAFAALGKNGQIIFIVPSQNLVMVRMGNSDGSPVPIIYVDDIWKNMNKVICGKTADNQLFVNENDRVYPNPVSETLFFSDSEKNFDLSIFDMQGRIMLTQTNVTASFSVKDLPRGTYFLKANSEKAFFYQKILKE